MPAPTADATPTLPVDPAAVARRVRELAAGLGFQRCGISGVELGPDEDHLRDWLAPRVDVPVVALMHPTEDTSSKFCYESFVRQSRPCLVQVGAWLRNFRSLKHIDAFPFRKVCIDSGPRGRGYQQLEESYQDVYNTDGLEVVGDYEMIDWLDKDQFDDLMAHSIVFLHLYDASASNITPTTHDHAASPTHVRASSSSSIMIRLQRRAWLARCRPELAR